MKKFLKTLAVFAAVAALGFGFASCADDDDDSGSGSALVAFSRVNSDGETETISFYSGNTYAVHIYHEETNFGVAGIMDLDVQKGTYTGDPTKDDSVVCTSVSQVDEEKMQKLMMGAILSHSKSPIQTVRSWLLIQAKLKRELVQSVVQRSLMTKATNTHENNLFRVYFFSTQASLAWIFFRVYINLKKLYSRS